MKIPWYILPIVAFVAGLLLGWQGCERQPCPECPEIEIVNGEVFPEEPTAIIKQPEVKKPISETPVNQIYVTHPSHEILIEKYDSLVQAYNTLSNYRRYADSIQFENLVVFYRGETLGYLNEIDIGIIDNRPTLTKTVTIRPPAEVKYAKGLYLGVTIGGNKDQFSNLSPGLDYVTPKIIVGANYNLMDQTVNVRVGRKLF